MGWGAAFVFALFIFMLLLYEFVRHFPGVGGGV
jgi:hypothetical protein